MSFLNTRLLKPFKNGFLILAISFIVWMLFMDSNSWLIHQELNESINKLEAEKAYYKNEILKDKKTIKHLKTKEGIEKFARETYYMKKDNEDIFLIEYDEQSKTNTKND